MQKDVALAEAGTLREWASQWEHSASAGPSDLSAQIVLGLRETADLIERSVCPEFAAAAPERETPLPPAVAVTEPRLDSPAESV